MRKNTFSEPEKTSPLSIDEIARLGAQEMIRISLEAEIRSFIERHKDMTLMTAARRSCATAITRNVHSRYHPRNSDGQSSPQP